MKARLSLIGFASSIRKNSSGDFQNFFNDSQIFVKAENARRTAGKIFQFFTPDDNWLGIIRFGDNDVDKRPVVFFPNVVFGKCFLSD